jgi:hypothetical protein
MRQHRLYGDRADLYDAIYAAKPYAGKEDVKPYAGDLFKGDKQKFEQTLAARADHENEYLRTGDAKK